MNKALRTLVFYNGIFVLAGGMFGPLYAVYVQGIGADIATISLSWAVFLISSTLFTFVLAKFGDSIHEKEYLLMLGFLVRAFVWIMYIFVQSVSMLIVLQLLLGVGEALGSPTFDSLAAEHLDKGKHIAEYSDMKVIFNLAGGLATILGGFIVQKWGFPSLFILMAVLALISFFGILAKPRKLL